MKESFNQALAFVLRSEGGNDDDPADHGGRTSRGITQREYTAWLTENNRPNGDVWKASAGEVSAIYYEEYWQPLCNTLPVGIDYLYFDMAVNAGPVRATILLQRSLGVTADGRIGPVTRQTITRANSQSLIAMYTAVKQDFYRSLHQPRFLKGWLNRCREVMVNANSMLKG